VTKVNISLFQTRVLLEDHTSQQSCGTPLSEISALQELHRFPSTSSALLSPQNDPSGWPTRLCQPDPEVFPGAERLYLAQEKVSFPNEIFPTSAPQQSRNINKYHIKHLPSLPRNKGLAGMGDAD